MRLTGNTGRKNCHFGTIAQLCRAMSSELRHVSTIEKKLLNSNTSSTCPDNMVNFGLLTAQICWRVWGTPANFNEFRVLAALLHGTIWDILLSQQMSYAPPIHAPRLRFMLNAWLHVRVINFRIIIIIIAVGVSQTLRRWTEGATCIRQGGHHVGHWPTFLV